MDTGNLVNCFLAAGGGSGTVFGVSFPLPMASWFVLALTDISKMEVVYSWQSVFS